MSYGYQPLSPVYKAPEAEPRAIELEEVVNVAPAVEPKPAESKCETSWCKKWCEKWKNAGSTGESKCQRRSCFGKASQPLTRGQKCCRCLGVTFATLFTVWAIFSTILVAYVGVKAHMCLHPRHLQVATSAFSPADIKTLELGVVTGKLTVRSCSKAKNISVTVRNYAATEALLATFDVETATDLPNSLFRVVVQQPSFDWRHCQHSWIEVVVPEHAQVNIDAQVLLGSVEIEGDHEALKNVNVVTKFSRVSLHEINATGTVSVTSTLGYVSAKEIVAAGLITRQGVGALAIYDVATPSINSAIDIGSACVGNIDVPTVVFASELAWANLWNVNSSNVTAFVEYGKLSVVPLPEYKGHFKATSPYGFLDVSQGSLAGDVDYKTNTEAEVEGTIGVTKAADAATPEEAIQLQDVSLTSVYGAVNFFVPNPHTKHWHEEHKEGKKHDEKKHH
jgi:hypothetical protein